MDVIAAAVAAGIEQMHRLGTYPSESAYAA